MSFYEIIGSLDASRIKKNLPKITTGQVRALLESISTGTIPNPEDIAILVSPAAAELLEPMAQLARTITARRFGRTIQIYAPLYISNHCSNSCVYCGFNVHNKINRRTSSREEILSEARLLKNKNISQLLLVSGECPAEVSVDLLEDIARDLKGLFPSLSIEIYPLDTPDYERLYRAGIDGLAIYQETYDQNLYSTVHPAGPKRDYQYRLGAPERGAAAGFRQIGIGSLLGLNDWRVESYYLMHHAAYLMKHFWKSQVSISFPRLRPAAGGYSPEFPISDSELVQMICAFRLMLPDAGLVLSTREPAHLRDSLIGLGITRMSAGSKTAPGGYLDEQGPAAEEQFNVFDDRPVEAVAESIRAKGYDTVWKDWDQGFEEQRAGESGNV
ncbi:MAG: 2-iminoacetate synthase ThiH [Candidatus Edwardsbacteria bacterium]|nr:2-iminoacetate synthase ThiH [Candidatus Edwardsbacteria bacterium]MBU1577363.1 2-iminoacetate synthase ThiH [Candidatus Edwardsbacteria bacterium]MBU2463197.1 2-iminoacetate synthase ThiH [Candidatus Edwardsbacteria bacterium]MBU2594168.1 2-iminoacetate synthase ThiH [Candidatus Edwardsbacteria bacterium]